MSQRSELDELTALYEQLGLAPDEPPQERRQHPRSVAKGHVSATLEAAGTVAVAVTVRDMSRSGIGVFAPNAIKVGERVAVSFRLGAGAVRAVCRVANCREDEAGRWVVGMAFVEVSRAAQSAAVPGVPAGELQSGMEAVGGADVGHVDDVVQRLRRTMQSS